MTRSGSNSSCTASPDRDYSPHRGARFVVAGLLSFIAACDVGAAASDDPWEIRVLTGADGAVSRFGPLRLQLDRRLSSWSVDRGSVRVSSGTVGESVFPSFDPLLSQLVLDLARPLFAETSYVVSLTGLIDLDGAPLDPPRQILLRTADGDIPSTSDPVPFASVSALLSLRCATVGCHTADARAAGLVLGDADGIRETALGQPSLQVDSPNAAFNADASGLIELPIIDGAGAPTSVARSYLIYKLLGDPHVLGERMPPPPDGKPLTPDEMQLVARWIASGASLE